MENERILKLHFCFVLFHFIYSVVHFFKDNLATLNTLGKLTFVRASGHITLKFMSVFPNFIVSHVQ